jgi:hypothetical protein
MAKSQRGKHGSVRSVDTEKAEDNSGFITRTHFNHGDSESYIEPKTHVHKNLKEVHAHMKACYPDEKE